MRSPISVHNGTRSSRSNPRYSVSSAGDGSGCPGAATALSLTGDGMSFTAFIFESLRCVDAVATVPQYERKRRPLAEIAYHRRVAFAIEEKAVKRVQGPRLAPWKASP